jgi:hypothetical protein
MGLLFAALLLVDSFFFIHIVSCMVCSIMMIGIIVVHLFLNELRLLDASLKKQFA